MADDPVATASRAAARRLAGRYGPRLAADVEAALVAGMRRDGGEAKPPARYVIDPIELAGLIVAIAAFAYQVYSDRKKQGHTPDQESMTRTVRIERRRYREITSADEEVIEIVTTEVIRAAGDHRG
jgi:hypothetical protein